MQTSSSHVSSPHPVLSGAATYGLARIGHANLDLSPEEVPREIALACRALHAEGCMKGIGGHVSVRAPGERAYWINPHDLEFSEVGEADIVKMSFSGELLHGSRYPSPGVYFHPDVYERRPEVTSVVHTHSPWMTRLAALRRSLRMVNVVSVYFEGDLVVTSDPLERIAEGLGTASNALIPYHGSLTVGTSLGETIAMHTTLEEAAHLDLTCDSDVEPMPAEDVERIRQVMVGTDYLEKTWELLRRKAAAELTTAGSIAPASL